MTDEPGEPKPYLDRIDELLDLIRRVADEQQSGSDGICGREAPRVSELTSRVFCQLRFGHRGWHEAGEQKWSRPELAMEYEAVPAEHGPADYIRRAHRDGRIRVARNGEVSIRSEFEPRRGWLGRLLDRMFG